MIPRFLAVLALAACAPTLANTLAGGDLRTRAASFRVASFDALPGWSSDNHSEAWEAFLKSCGALVRRESWRELCGEARTLAARDNSSLRGFFERHFTLLAVQKTDSSSEGEITGYYEPLIAGRRSPGGAFVVPVHGAPRDLYTFDWRHIAPAQRKTSIAVRAAGRTLVPAAARDPGAMNIDLRSFALDSLDRRLRLRTKNNQALPYYARSEINSMRSFDAPVIAWVDDALALYAMQVQGSGRIRMTDGTTLRVQFAEQNGHPFRPLRIASASRDGAADRVRTRGIADSEEEPESFAFADTPAPAGEQPLTRGLKPTSRSSANKVDAVVEQLLSQTAARPTRADPAAHDTLPASTLTATQREERARRIDSDPSYVFFQVAPDQSSRSGPIGALGVPLTPGRSVAVDPRVTPLGYPVYLSAHAAGGPGIERLVFAQDTGGAIRGAVRADFFWGFGAQAGREALRTRHSGRMWVMLPHAEARAALATAPLKRGIEAPGEQLRECLLADEDEC